jgi:AdoMet-dependent heme synthase
MALFNINERPFQVIWEITRACPLACQSCRPRLDARRHPLELSTDESLRLLDQVARCRPARLIITGGDPLRRLNLETLLRHAAYKGLTVHLQASPTQAMADADFAQWKELGVERLSLSLDGTTEESFDAFRGVRGLWNRTMQMILKTIEADLPMEFHTCLTRRNAVELDQFVEILRPLNPVSWHLALPVSLRSAPSDNLLTGWDVERAFMELQTLAQAAPFDVQVNEGSHYRRVLLQKRGIKISSQPSVGRATERTSPAAVSGHRDPFNSPSQGADSRWNKTETGNVGAHPDASPAGRSMENAGEPAVVPVNSETLSHAPLPLNDGRGSVFISPLGEIYPGPQLPLAAGQVRLHDLLDVYQNSALFCRLRQPQLLKGKCGRCEFNALCGGSRARAYAMNRDYLAEDPLCVHRPGASSRFTETATTANCF